MKIIKIILGIISAFVFVFFLTGLLIKETNYSSQVFINESIDEVFYSFNNIENRKYWIPEVNSVEVIKEKPGKIGSVYKVIVDNHGQKITMTEKVLAYIKNEKVTLFFDAENILKRNDYLFKEKKGVTIITLNSSCQRESYIMACLYAYFKETLKEQDQAYLNNFKALIEKKEPKS